MVAVGKTTDPLNSGGWLFFPHQAPTITKRCRTKCHVTPHETAVDCATNRVKPGVWSRSTTDLTDTDCLPWPLQHARAGRVAYQPEQSLCCRWLMALGWLEGLLSADALAEGFEDSTLGQGALMHPAR